MTTAPLDERPPNLGRRMVLKAVAAGVTITLAVGAGVTGIGLLQLDNVRDAFIEARGSDGGIKIDSLPPVQAGKPQTIMILGTDERMGADQSSTEEARSDTIILARLDPKAKAISLLSIPRDLKVTLPDTGYPDKINSAFTRGGANLTKKTVEGLLSNDEDKVRINHVVQISFSGFRELVDYLNCTWVDVDRRYFNDVGGPGGYATIDIEPGYQKLCGKDSLDYVRYRHTDNDLVRGARQQDYLRQMLRQNGVRRRLNYDNRIQLAKLAGKYTRTDKSLETNKGIINLLKLGLGTADKPVVQVPFGDGRIEDDGSFLTASDDAIADTVRLFMHPKVEQGSSAGSSTSSSSTSSSTSRKSSSSSSSKSRKRKSSSSSKADKWEDTAGMTSARETGENMAIPQANRLGFPFYFPTLIPATGQFVDDAPHRYSIRVGRKVHRAYRTVINVGGTSGFGQYMGVQGTSWKNPPALQGSHDTITVDRRKLEVFWDGRKVRLVAWRTPNGVYWVSNTLTRDQPYTRMVAMARSLSRLGA